MPQVAVTPHTITEKIPILGGAYEARSPIAGAQRCINLYPEINPPDSQAPFPVTHYPTPGLVQIGEPDIIRGWRAGYRATNGDFYGVCGPNVYYIDPLWNLTLVGTIPDGQTRPSLSDNGQVIVIVDGSASGWCIEMSTRTFGTITDSDFYGADRVDYLDTYFIFNRPGTNQFYISLSNVSFAMLTGGSGFDPLDIAAKTGGPDPIVTLVVVNRQLLLIGQLTSEVWTNTGAADFTFSPIPGILLEHGCAAVYSLAKMDTKAYWLAQDREGFGIVVESDGYTIKAVSTYTIDAEIQSYRTTSNAFGGCYQQQGHGFYAITFPTADHTWQREVSTGKWNEWGSLDSNGVLHRFRANFFAFVYGVNVVGDFSNGKLYHLDPEEFTEDGAPIPRLRTFPHVVKDGKRVTHKQLALSMQTGTLPESMTDDPPELSIRWSDDGGASWGNPVTVPMGSGGQYLTQPQMQRLGISRDRIYEVSWSTPTKTALNGAWLDSERLGT